MINKFFDRVVCLTQKERVDRQLLFEQEAEKHGISFEYYYALEGNPKESFCYSQIEILKTCTERMLVLEDDVLFKNLENFTQVLGELPENWDMLYLGANARPYEGHREYENYSEHLRRIRSCFTTHAVAYTKATATKIVSSYEYTEGQLYDTWLDQYIDSVNAYITVPFLAIQRPTRSDLWDRFVDYLDVFEESEKYLNGKAHNVLFL